MNWLISFPDYTTNFIFNHIWPPEGRTIIGCTGNCRKSPISAILIFAPREPKLKQSRPNTTNGNTKFEVNWRKSPISAILIFATREPKLRQSRPNSTNGNTKFEVNWVQMTVGNPGTDGPTLLQHSYVYFLYRCKYIHSLFSLYIYKYTYNGNMYIYIYIHSHFDSSCPL